VSYLNGGTPLLGGDTRIGSGDLATVEADAAIGRRLSIVPKIAEDGDELGRSALALWVTSYESACLPRPETASAG
jgi:hypothetical protein